MKENLFPPILVGTNFPLSQISKMPTHGGEERDEGKREGEEQDGDRFHFRYPLCCSLIFDSSLQSSFRFFTLVQTKKRKNLKNFSLRVCEGFEGHLKIAMWFETYSGGCRVLVDERDVSMDSTYRKELQAILGEKKNVPLPQVFIGGKYMGGAEVIKYLFEVGELAKILEAFPKRKPGFICDSCGDVRFVPCITCSGSRKVFDEDEGLLKRCLVCNENGLIRCPDCCS